MDSRRSLFGEAGPEDVECGEVVITCEAQTRADPARQVPGSAVTCYSGDKAIQVQTCDVVIAKRSDLERAIGELPLVTNVATNWDRVDPRQQSAVGGAEVLWKFMGVCGEDGLLQGKQVRVQTQGVTDMYLPHLNCSPKSEWAHEDMLFYARLPYPEELPHRWALPAKEGHSRVLLEAHCLAAAANQDHAGFARTACQQQVQEWTRTLRSRKTSAAQQLFPLLKQCVVDYVTRAARREDNIQYVGQCVRQGYFGEMSRVYM